MKVHRLGYAVYTGGEDITGTEMDASHTCKPHRETRVLNATECSTRLVYYAWREVNAAHEMHRAGRQRGLIVAKGTSLDDPVNRARRNCLRQDGRPHGFRRLVCAQRA